MLRQIAPTKEKISEGSLSFQNPTAFQHGPSMHHSGYTIDSSYISSIPVRNLKSNRQGTICHKASEAWENAPADSRRNYRGQAGTLRQKNHTVQDNPERKTLSSYNDFFSFTEQKELQL